jgi:hypothetical protein
VICLDDGLKTMALQVRQLERNGAGRVLYMENWKKEWQMASKPVEKDTSRAQDYRSKAAECAEIAQQSPASEVDSDLHRREQSYLTLAENEEWLDRNFDKLISE